VKFNDADLLGLPIRLTVSERTLKDQSVELKLRTKPDKIMIGRDEAVARVKREIQTMVSDTEKGLDSLG
jgi:prolyl-tRNA synthetase